jgi:hypothetical protein
MWVLILNDGTALIPMRDPEGNGPGHLDIAETGLPTRLLMPPPMMRTEDVLAP